MIATATNNGNPRVRKTRIPSLNMILVLAGAIFIGAYVEIRSEVSVQSNPSANLREMHIVQGRR